MENWRDVPGYEGKYQVSNLGRIKSLNYRKTGKGCILKTNKNHKGYLTINLCLNGKYKCFFIHRLVWLAFVGPIPEGMQINHINEDKTDNRLENLNLMTPSQNSNWGTRNNRLSKMKNKVVEQYSFDGTHLCTWFSMKGVQDELGYSQGTISMCCNGKRNHAYGFVWKYA